MFFISICVFCSNHQPFLVDQRSFDRLKWSFVCDPQTWQDGDAVPGLKYMLHFYLLLNCTEVRCY